MGEICGKAEQENAPLNLDRRGSQGKTASQRSKYSYMAFVKHYWEGSDGKSEGEAWK